MCRSQKELPEKKKREKEARIFLNIQQPKKGFLQPKERVFVCVCVCVCSLFLLQKLTDQSQKKTCLEQASLVSPARSYGVDRVQRKALSRSMQAGFRRSGTVADTTRAYLLKPKIKTMRNPVSCSCPERACLQAKILFWQVKENQKEQPFWRFPHFASPDLTPKSGPFRFP